MILRVALGCDYLWYGAYVVMPLVYRLVCLFVGELVICLCWVCLFCACGCLGCLVRGLVWWFFWYLLVLLILVVGYLLGCYLLVIMLIVVLAGDLCFDVVLLFACRFVLFVAVCGALVFGCDFVGFCGWRCTSGVLVLRCCCGSLCCLLWWYGGCGAGCLLFFTLIVGLMVFGCAVAVGFRCLVVVYWRLFLCC